MYRITNDNLKRVADLFELDDAALLIYFRRYKRVSFRGRVVYTRPNPERWQSLKAIRAEIRERAQLAFGS